MPYPVRGGDPAPSGGDQEVFTSEGKMEREIDKQIGATLAVTLRSIFLPFLTCGHEPWTVTERTRSQVQAAEMSFLHRDG